MSMFREVDDFVLVEDEEKSLAELKAKVESLEKKLDSLPKPATPSKARSFPPLSTDMRKPVGLVDNNPVSGPKIAGVLAASSPLFHSSSSSSSSFSSPMPVIASPTTATARDLSARGNGVGVAGSAAVRADAKVDAEAFTYRSQKGDVVDSSSRTTTTIINPTSAPGSTTVINVTVAPPDPPKPGSHGCCLIL